MNYHVAPPPTDLSLVSSSIRNNVAGDLSIPSCNNASAGDLMSGKAFDNGCICQQANYGDMVDSILRGVSSRSCQCCAPQLQPEMEFVNALMNIGTKLGALDTKEQRS